MMAKRKSGGDQLIFSWTKGGMGWLYLAAFTVFSITIHGAGFYLFKVVYPTPTRVEPTMHRISVLDSSDPEVRSLFQRLRDRTIFLSPPSEHAGVRVRLQDHEVRFIPSFQNTEVEPLSPSFPWSLTLQDHLETDFSETGKRGAASLSFDSDLKELEVAPWSILEGYLSRADSVPAFRARIEVTAEGKVSVIEIDAELTEEERDELTQVIESTLRFRAGGKKTQGWMDVWARG